jgi:hypothetical protein
MTTDKPFEDDPALGAFVANYPGNRARLLMIGAGIMIAAWFVVTVALWEVEDNAAAIITVIVLALVALVVGWYITHLWNREVVLYEHGFSYREGSGEVHMRYDEIQTIRQRGKRRSYFFGLLQREVYLMTMTTIRGETIALNDVYKRLDELTIRLEQAITRALQPIAERRLEAGEQIDFNPVLAMSKDGLRQEGRDLPWDDFAGFRLESGQLILMAEHDRNWHQIPLEDIDNLRLFINLLRQQQPQEPGA